MTTKATTLSCRHSAVSSGIRPPPPRQGHSPTVPVPALSPNSPRAHPRPHRLLRRPRDDAAMSRTGPGRGTQEGTSQAGGNLHGGGGSGNSGARHYRRKEVGGDRHHHPLYRPTPAPCTQRPAPEPKPRPCPSPAHEPRPISHPYRPLRPGPAPKQYLPRAQTPPLLHRGHTSRAQAPPSPGGRRPAIAPVSNWG